MAIQTPSQLTFEAVSGLIKRFFLTVLAPDKAVNSGGLDGLGRKANNEKQATKHDLVFMIHYLWVHGLLFRGS